MNIERPMRTEAIKRFLEARTHPDLAALYHYGMEVQIIVAPDGGDRVEGDFKGKAWHGYTDGMTTWKPFRIPLDPGGEPHYEDRPLNYELEAHALGIGMTGWCWQARESVYVGYDFDAICGHAESHKKKLTDAELRAVQKAACEIPWVTVRRSTGGNGIHLYVFLDDYPTSNHTEHAALARAILGKMSAIVGYDFTIKVDNCGGNFWVWHRKMTRANEGLGLIKQGDVLYDVPPNWREHLQVIKGTRRKTLPVVIEESPVADIEKMFDDLTSQRSHVPLDEDHRKVINWLNDNGAQAYWDQDRHMLVTHTYWLKKCHEELGLRGIFETQAKGREAGDINCYLFPMRKGAWSVRRFTPGVAEHPSWSQDGGWTSTFYNREPDLVTAAKSNGGVEHRGGGYVFVHASDAVEAARNIGVTIELPPWAQSRKAKLKEHKDNRLIVEIDHDPNNDSMAGGLPGWLAEGKTWSRVFHANLRPQIEVEVGNYDDVVRHLVTETGDDAGWTVKSEGTWVCEPLAHVKVALQGALGMSPKEVTAVVGSAVLRNWRIVNHPFQPEYPGDRQWNRGAAQFRYAPTDDRDDLVYPTWMKVLSHCGAGLDDAIKNHGWCKSNGILTGGDYLKVWIASLFQQPMSPLPYLFLYSQDQNTGKSIFHEALAELMTRGVERADQALTNPSGFNGELANAVLCVVEETDLSKSRVAYNRIKDWVTSRQLPVHVKGLTPYTIPNTTHWCFSGSTWVFTSEGGRQIRELVGRPVVVRYNGRSYETEGAFVQGYREVFEIETGEGYKVRATADHQFVVEVAGDLVLDVPVSAITPGTRLCLCNHSQPDWVGRGGTFGDGYLLGWLFGDGTVAKRRNGRVPKLYFCPPDEDLIPYVIGLFPEHPQVSPEDGRIVLTSPYLHDLCERYGVGSDKAVSPHIESESSDFLRGFLSAFFDADGSAGDHLHGVTLRQSDLGRVEATQRVLAHFGIASRIYPSESSGFNPGSATYALTLRKSNMARFQELIGFRHPAKRAALAATVEHRSTLAGLRPEDFRVTVKSVTSVGMEHVYGITVPGIQHLSANGFAAHNCQCSNDHKYCPIFSGDTRITMVLVSALEPEDLIPKEQLLGMLRKEAPDFMAEVLRLEIPQSGDRLAVPVVVTGEKINAQRANQTRLEEFIQDRCHHVTGRMIKFSEFVERFHEWLDANEVHEWSKITVGKNLPPHYPKGRRPKDGQFYIGNIDWSPLRPGEEILPKLLVNEKEMLVPVGG